MTDHVTPLRRNKPEPPPVDDGLSRHSRRAQPGARKLAAEQAAPHREGYMTAVGRQQAERLIATGKIVPARITIALDMRMLEGPEVDVMCGAEEPAVDMWELGLWVPTAEQLAKLADLTGFQVAWFYKPIKPGPFTSSPIFVCDRSKRKNGCTVLEPDVITPEGVLLYEGKPRPLPKGIKPNLAAAQGELF
jgi:hypothetical protein